MQTLTLPRRPFERLFTVADVAQMPNELPSGPVLYELHQGRLVIMAPPGDIHGAVESKLAFELILQGDRRGFGKTRSGESGLVLSRGHLESLYGVDALFIATSRLPIRRSLEGYLITVPSIVAEVKSKNDSPKSLADKIAAYLEADVNLVWLVDPYKKTIAIHQKRRKPVLLTESDTLTAEPVIPGFAVAVASLFEE
jgi:Uma2 family endonuclease